MTGRQVFITVVRHLATQGRPARLTTGSVTGCQYRLITKEREVLMCAAGCLLKTYSRTFEGQVVPTTKARTWTPTQRDIVTALGARLAKTRQLIWELQNVHDAWRISKFDDAYHFDTLVPSLNAIAKRHRFPSVARVLRMTQEEAR